MSAAKIPVTTHSFTLSMNKPPYQTEEHWPQQMRLTNVPIISTPRDVNRINLSLLETLFWQRLKWREIPTSFFSCLWWLRLSELLIEGCSGWVPGVIHLTVHGSTLFWGHVAFADWHQMESNRRPFGHCITFWISLELEVVWEKTLKTLQTQAPNRWSHRSKTPFCQVIMAIPFVTSSGVSAWSCIFWTFYVKCFLGGCEQKVRKKQRKGGKKEEDFISTFDFCFLLLGQSLMK